MYARLNHRKKMKGEPSQMIRRKPIENLELLIVNPGACNLRCKI